MAKKGINIGASDKNLNPIALGDVIELIKDDNSDRYVGTVIAHCGSYSAKCEHVSIPFRSWGKYSITILRKWDEVSPDVNAATKAKPRKNQEPDCVAKAENPAIDVKPCGLQSFSDRELYDELRARGYSGPLVKTLE